MQVPHSFIILSNPGGPQPPSNGFALAIAILIGMVAALLYTGVVVMRGFRGVPPPTVAGWQKLALPLLALAGLGVAAYLSYVEARAVPALCGSIGDCSTVQTSSYAKLFGVPVGMLGAAGYGAILAAWLWGQWRTDGLSSYAPLVVFCLALFGTLFSAYLTYLEPFIIRAVCLWCLTSAVIITLLLLLSTGPMLRAMAVLEEEAESD